MFQLIHQFTVNQMYPQLTHPPLAINPLISQLINQLINLWLIQLINRWITNLLTLLTELINLLTLSPNHHHSCAEFALNQIPKLTTHLVFHL